VSLIKERGKMKINNLKNRGFAKLSVLALILILVAGLLTVSCSGSDSDKKAAVKEVKKSIEEIKDSSVEFSGNIAQATCLECHPAVKDGGFDIDFEKVKAAGMIRGKNMDIVKEADKKPEKK